LLIPLLSDQAKIARQKEEGGMLTSKGAISIDDECSSINPTSKINIKYYCVRGCSPALIVDVFGSDKSFCLFTSAVAIANAASSGFIGDIGTNEETISSFETLTIVVSFYNENAVSSQAKADLNAAYTLLNEYP
jgi:hypothetical protein